MIHCAIKFFYHFVMHWRKSSVNKSQTRLDDVSVSHLLVENREFLFVLYLYLTPPPFEVDLVEISERFLFSRKPD